jgi:translation initiation factor 4E
MGEAAVLLSAWLLHTTIRGGGCRRCRALTFPYLSFILPSLHACSLYNNIIPPSRLSPGSDLHLFREGVEPKWEDPRCEHGGKWTAMVPKGNKQLLDTMWLHGVLGCIGEQFDDGEEICGIVVNVRPKQDRISVWTKTAANEALQVGGHAPRGKILRLDHRSAVVVGPLLRAWRQRMQRMQAAGGWEARVVQGAWCRRSAPGAFPVGRASGTWCRSLLAVF